MRELTRLVGLRASLLHARSDLADETRLLAVASKVGQARASVALDSSHETVELIIAC